MKIASIVRAGVLGLALAAASVPAEAASMGFGFGFGMGNGFGFGMGNGFGRHRPFICVEMTDRQIRNAVSRQGYRNIFLNQPIGRRIQVRATKGSWVYLLRVSTCSGQILERRRLRRA
jgi:hypothetical protein